MTADGKSQPYDLTAVEQAAALRRGELSAVELVEHYLRRIESLDHLLGAFVTLTPDAALTQAAAADRALRDGDERPLLGVPTAIKDLAMTAGVRTTLGSPVYADYVPEVDDDSARLLRAAGTISLGKTSTPEFGLPPYTEPAGRPPAVTPWDTSRLAGGSSGGAGAATAGGLVPFAHGTDGGGSIRCPAAACGLVGLKTSRGLVSRGPVGGDPPGMSVSGPLARTVADAAAMLDALARPVTGEPFVLEARVDSHLAAAGRPPAKLRVGRYAVPPVQGVASTPPASPRTRRRPPCWPSWATRSSSSTRASPRTSCPRSRCCGRCSRTGTPCRRRPSRCSLRSPGGGAAAVRRSVGRSIWQPPGRRSRPPAGS